MKAENHIFYINTTPIQYIYMKSTRYKEILRARLILLKFIFVVRSKL